MKSNFIKIILVILAVVVFLIGFHNIYMFFVSHISWENTMDIYFIISKYNFRKSFITFQENDLVDFMWGKDFKNYEFWKNFRRIDFSGYKHDEYVNLNNFHKFLKKY